MTKNNKETKKEKEKKTNLELRQVEFKQGLVKLQEDTQVSIEAKLNFSEKGVVPFIQLTDIKQDENETEEKADTEEA